MGESTNQIEREIAAERDNLGKNLNELEDKAKSMTDWRSHFNKNPMTMIAVAFGGGIVLASVLGGSKRNHRWQQSSVSNPEFSTMHAGYENGKNQMVETWDNIKGAIVGVAATRFKDFVGEIVPGFKEQLRSTENKKSGSL